MTPDMLNEGISAVIYDMGKFDHVCFESGLKELCELFITYNGRFYDKPLSVVPLSSIREIEFDEIPLPVGKVVCRSPQ